MSLNGLDDEIVVDAFRAATAEPGAWFLLKYSTRDAVDLLARGVGGVTELRQAIAGYTEPSPLYGFIRYRRRSVIIKYVPEGTSRLLQARLAVHFQSVIEKFSPHDTVFPISAPADLKENALSAACSLHAASNSTSSTNSSLQRKRLGEITEDAEENRRSKAENEKKTEKPLPPLPTEQESTLLQQVLASSQERPTSKNGNTERAIRDAVEAATSPPLEPSRERSGTTTSATIPIIHHRNPSAATSFTRSAISRPEPEPRTSSNSLRPSLRDLDNATTLNMKPKIKLGPRPSFDLGGRTQAAGHRPVSTLPAGLRVAQRKPAPTNQARAQNSAPNIHQTPSTPSVSSPPPVSASVITRPVTSPSSLNTDAASVRSTASKASNMTPEKQRLMKALQLRKKQIIAASGQSKINEDKVDAVSVPEAPPAVEPPSVGQEKKDALDPNPPDVTANVTDLSMAGPRTEPGNPTSNQSGSSPISPTGSPELVSSKASSVSEEETPKAKEAIAQSPIGSNGSAVKKSIQSESVNAATNGLIGAPDVREDLGALPDSIPVDDAEVTVLDAASSALPPSGQITPTDPRQRERDEASPVPEEVPQSEDVQMESTSPHDVDESAQQTPRAPALPDAADFGSPRAASKEAETVPEESSVSERLQPGAEQNGAQLAASSQLGDGLPIPVDSVTRESSTNSMVSISTTESGSKRGSLTQGLGPRRKKRRGPIEPIRTDLSPDISDDDSDDSLMDELSHATVLEAKPVSVRKSPLASTFSRPTSERQASEHLVGSRAASNPGLPSMSASKGSFSEIESNDDGKGRSFSSTFLDTRDQRHGPIAMIKKINVSSGISQRIKALELVSSQAARPATPPSSSTPPGSGSLYRNASARSSPGKGNLQSSPSTPNNGMGLAQPPTSSPIQQLHSDRVKGFENQKPQRGESVKAQHHRESVSVRARIIRVSEDIFPRKPTKNIEPQDEPALELRESPLTIEHYGGSRRESESNLKSPLSPKSDRPLSILSSGSRHSSDPNSVTANRRQSAASKRSSKSDARSPSASRKSSSSGVASAEERRESRKDSAKNRIFRRMSSMSNASRKSLVHAISPTVREDTLMEHVSAADVTRESVDIGEVNVQFPDSLLWKRRCLKLDSQGYINLTQAKADESTRTSARRYHLSEFKPPFAPDQDRQELAYSVILDFRDGSTLQCACEHPKDQVHVLQTLQASHRNWNQ
ncbi:MAG: hypothetical protein M1817_005698 [Caeruleum heppii]|nr:MAG: hypothetical protein M1817_005698 [Caeruleum heppii]